MLYMTSKGNHTYVADFLRGGAGRLKALLRAALMAALLVLPATEVWAGSAPTISSLSDTTLPRSGRLVIFGSSFGSTPGEILIDGQSAIVTRWYPGEIHAYVPESAALGSVPVQVVTSGGAGNILALQVTLRQSNGRIQWTFQTDSYIPLQFVARGSDGTVYVSDLVGLYALSPDGALLWFTAGAGDGRPISFAADGTIYTGGVAGGLISALNPDGSVRWTVPNDAPGLSLLAGPNVGPDGNIYAVQDSSSNAEGLGQFSVDADGNLRFSQVQFFSFAGGNSEITFGDGQWYGSWEFNASGPATIHVFDMDNGNLLWDAGDVGVSANGYPVLDSFGRLLLAWGQVGMVAVTPDGDPDWISVHPSENGTNVLLQATVGASGTAYTGDWLGVELWALDPGGNTIWIAEDIGHLLQDVSVSPDESVIVSTGTEGFGEPTWIRAFDTADGSLVWHVELPPENGVNQFGSSWAAIFTPGSSTTYVASGFVGDVNNYGYLYALDVPFDPALDGDADGYPDDNDNCPDLPNQDQIDSDDDGIGDACDFIPDDCADALPMCPGMVTGSTVGATNDGQSSCSPNAHVNKDVWYSYTASIDGTVTVDGCGAAYSYYLSVHTGCPGTPINEVGCALYGCGGVWPSITFDVTAGQTYYIRVNGFNAVEIDYTLSLTGPECGSAERSADLNDDGQINAADLSMLLGTWGPCAECASDLNDNGMVESNDLAMLLGQWGS